MSMKIERQVQLPQTQPSKQGATFLRTCFNGINTLAGIGILSIPYALSEGGWLSLAFLFIVALLCWYTGLLLHRCLESNPLIKSYPDIGGLAFGYKGRAFISLFMYFELFLAAVEFLILEGDNLTKLFPNSKLFAVIKLSNKQGFTILAALVVLPTTWLRNLGVLAYVSFGGVLASLLVVCSVLWVGAFDGVGFHQRGMFFDWKGLPTSMSLYTFCYCGHAVFPTIQNSMKDRSKFPKVLTICFGLSTIIYGIMAIGGYLMFGENVQSQVTLSLPVAKIGSQVAIYTTLINPITKFAVIIAPLAIGIEDRLVPFGNNRLISVLVRTVLVLSAVIVALTIPFFGYVVAFTGAFLSVTVSILFPCLCHLKLNPKARKLGQELIILASILVVGSVVGVMGTYTSVRSIVDELRSQ
ncbi:Amino acid transporter AVT1J-like protein [Drosera capensis]